MSQFLIGVFWLVVFLGLWWFVRRLRRTGKHNKEKQNPAPAHRRKASAGEPFWVNARSSPFDALAHLQNGDYDGARRALQKISYMVYAERKNRPELVDQFTALMCEFTRIDPLFGQCMKIILPLVQQSPGIRQTDLYPYLPVDVETARYVLYFAHETGAIFRKKKGNSYTVFPS